MAPAVPVEPGLFSHPINDEPVDYRHLKSPEHKDTEQALRTPFSVPRPCVDE